jgi:hypothetical protein
MSSQPAKSSIRFRENLGWMFAGGLGFFLLGGFVGQETAPLSDVADCLRAKRLEIVSADGSSVLMRLESVPGEGGRLVSIPFPTDERGREFELSSRGLSFRDKENHIVKLGIKQSGGYLAIVSPTAFPACSLELDETGAGRLGLYDKEAKGRDFLPHSTAISELHRGGK